MQNTASPWRILYSYSRQEKQDDALLRIAFVTELLRLKHVRLQEDLESVSNARQVL